MPSVELFTHTWTPTAPNLDTYGDRQHPAHHRSHGNPGLSCRIDRILHIPSGATLYAAKVDSRDGSVRIWQSLLTRDLTATLTALCRWAERSETPEHKDDLRRVLNQSPAVKAELKVFLKTKLGESCMESSPKYRRILDQQIGPIKVSISHEEFTTAGATISEYSVRFHRNGGSPSVWGGESLPGVLARIKDAMGKPDAVDLYDLPELTPEVVDELMHSPGVRAEMKAATKLRLESDDPGVRTIYRRRFGHCEVLILHAPTLGRDGRLARYQLPYIFRWYTPGAPTLSIYGPTITELVKKVRSEVDPDENTAVPFDLTPEVLAEIIATPEVRAELQAAVKGHLGEAKFSHKEMVSALLDLDTFEPGPVIVYASALVERPQIRKIWRLAAKHGALHIGIGGQCEFRFSSLAKAKQMGQELGDVKLTFNTTVGCIIMAAGGIYFKITPYWE